MEAAAPLHYMCLLSLYIWENHYNDLDFVFSMSFFIKVYHYKDFSYKNWFCFTWDKLNMNFVSVIFLWYINNENVDIWLNFGLIFWIYLSHMKCICNVSWNLNKSRFILSFRSKHIYMYFFVEAKNIIMT